MTAGQTGQDEKQGVNNMEELELYIPKPEDLSLEAIAQNSEE